MRQASLSQRVQLLLIESEADWDAFLGQHGEGLPSERAILQQLISVARTHGCNAVAVEEQYTDRDYRAEFATVSAGVHRAPSRTTTRVVFFQLTPTEHADGRLPDEEQADAGRCVGYSVLRPLRVGRVGRTFVSPP